VIDLCKQNMVMQKTAYSAGGFIDIFARAPWYGLASNFW
jgi:hypothetical protein